MKFLNLFYTATSLLLLSALPGGAAADNSAHVQQVETLFMMTSPECAYLSSSIVKEVGRLGGDIRSFVPRLVADRLYQKFSENE